jgi:glycosyltransferase involved in cell wall biosynthesis
MSSPLRIAAILRALPGASGKGGVSYQVHHLLERFARGGHRITVFSADPAPPGAGYEVRRIPVDDAVKDRRVFHYLGFARRVARQDFSGFDLIHAHGDNQFLRRPGPPVVRTYWGSDLGELKGDLRLVPVASHLLGYGLEWLARKRADVTVGISENTKKDLPFLDHVIPPGVDLDVFAPGGEKSVRPSILYVAGTLGGRKRGRLLVEAFHAEVRAALPEAELWVVCPEEVEGSGVRWFGTLGTDASGLAALANLYRRAWVFCLPSSYEGFGLPYVEAMACGTAVVATANPGALEILEGGALGVIAEPGELGRRLVALLHDEPRRLDLAARGLGRVERYSLASVALRYEAVFRDLVAARRRAG